MLSLHCLSARLVLAVLVATASAAPALAEAPEPAIEAPIAAAASAILEAHAEAPVLVIGELHGTREAPALIAALAGRIGASRALSVALEIPAQEQARVDDYLASDGAAAATRALLAGAFWQRPRERSDGRRSQATLDLIDQLRLLRAEQADLRVLLFDDQDFHGQTRSRDALMAERLRAAQAQRPSAQLLVLTGNYHARLDPLARAHFGQAQIQPPPMASLLQDLGLVSINLSARTGAFWGCTSPTEPCGVVPLPQPQPRGSAALAPAGLVRSAEAGDADTAVRATPGGNSYHLQLELPRFTPSEPVPASP
jgi:hypothetical protein